MPDIQRDNLKILITSQSIIVAGLLAWAQLWSRTYNIYITNGDPIWTGSLSLAGIYVAVFASVLSIVFCILAMIKLPSAGWPLKWALTLACLSLLILILIVLVSGIGIYIKALRGDSVWHPFMSSWNPIYTTLGVSVFGLAIFASIWRFLTPWFIEVAQSKKHKDEVSILKQSWLWFMGIGIFVIAGIVLLIIASRGLHTDSPSNSMNGVNNYKFGLDVAGLSFSFLGGLALSWRVLTSTKKSVIKESVTQVPVLSETESNEGLDQRLESATASLPSTVVKLKELDFGRYGVILLTVGFFLQLLSVMIFRG